MKTPIQILEEHLKEVRWCRIRAARNKNTDDTPALCAAEKEFKNAITAIKTANRIQANIDIKKAIEIKHIDIKKTIETKHIGRPKGSPNKLVIDREPDRTYDIILSNGRKFKRLLMEDCKF